MGVGGVGVRGMGVGGVGVGVGGRQGGSLPPQAESAPRRAAVLRFGLGAGLVVAGVGFVLLALATARGVPRVVCGRAQLRSRGVGGGGAESTEGNGHTRSWQ